LSAEERSYGEVMMKKNFILTMILIWVILLSGVSFASIPDNLAIDFRAFSEADDEDSYTQDGVTVEALPDNSIFDYKLSYDSVDGLGIKWRFGGGPDEIEGVEKLKVTIDGGMKLSGVWITNLYVDKITKWVNLSEFGTVTINNSMVFNFDANDPGLQDGNLWVGFGKDIYVETAVFETPYLGLGYSEFSVAGFTAPIPGSLLLLGSGLVGLIGIRRKR
jgi:hypothetical protein